MSRFNIPGHRFRRKLALFAIVSTSGIGGFAHSETLSNLPAADAAIGTNGLGIPSGYSPSVPGANVPRTGEIFTTTPRATTAWLIVAGIWFLTFTWKRRRNHPRR